MKIGFRPTPLFVPPVWKKGTPPSTASDTTPHVVVDIVASIAPIVLDGILLVFLFALPTVRLAQSQSGTIFGLPYSVQARPRRRSRSLNYLSVHLFPGLLPLLVLCPRFEQTPFEPVPPNIIEPVITLPNGVRTSLWTLSTHPIRVVSPVQFALGGRSHVCHLFLGFFLDLTHTLVPCRFNIYIYDYCNKRGFVKTARELVNEAEIPVESQPPINAKQGLLFEYASYPTELRFLLAHLHFAQVVECFLGIIPSKKQRNGVR